MSDVTGHGRPQSRAADHVGFAVKWLDEPLQFWIEGLGAELIGVSGGDGMFLNAVTGTPSESARIGLALLAGQKWSYSSIVEARDRTITPPRLTEPAPPMSRSRSTT